VSCRVTHVHSRFDVKTATEPCPRRNLQPDEAILTRQCSGRLVHKRQSTGHDGFHKIRKDFCVLSRLFGYAAKKCSDFLCFNDANCLPINTEQIIGFALLRSMSPGKDLMLCANILLAIGVAPPAK
jgi:hypothetical protein